MCECVYVSMYACVFTVAASLDEFVCLHISVFKSPEYVFFLCIFKHCVDLSYTDT